MHVYVCEKYIHVILKFSIKRVLNREQLKNGGEKIHCFQFIIIEKLYWLIQMSRGKKGGSIERIRMGKNENTCEKGYLWQQHFCPCFCTVYLLFVKKVGGWGKGGPLIWLIIIDCQFPTLTSGDKKKIMDSLSYKCISSKLRPLTWLKPRATRLYIVHLYQLFILLFIIIILESLFELSTSSRFSLIIRAS